MEGRKHIALRFHLRGRSRRLDIGWHIGSFEIDSRVEARLGRDPARNDELFLMTRNIYHYRQLDRCPLYIQGPIHYWN